LDRSDWNLVEEVKAGKLDSFNELMIRYQQTVFQVAVSFTKNMDDALDLSQTVFLKVYEHLNKFRGESQFKTWLMRITLNESNNWNRKTKKRHMETFDEYKAEKTSDMLPEDEYLVSENRAALLRCLLELNTRHRLAVVLRYFENYSITDIAATLDCSEGVVKNMLFRSLQKLRSKLNIANSGVH